MRRLKTRTVAVFGASSAAVFGALILIAVPVGGVAPQGAPPMPQAGDNPVLAPFPNIGDGGPTTVGVKKALAGPLSKNGLGPTVLAAVYDAGSGKLIYQQGSKQPATPASTNKVLTAATVLTAYGADYRISTQVVRGSNPNEVVIVGAGDPLLQSEPAKDPGQPSAPASLTELARQTAVALKKATAKPAPITVRYDDSLFQGPTASPTWSNNLVSEGIVSGITALMVDGGGGSNPSPAAAQKFADLLEAQGVAVRGSVGRATGQTSEVLATVRSAPLSTAIAHTLEESDNTAAEVLGHLAGAKVVNDGSFAGGAEAVTEVLSQLQVSTQGVKLFDASGLSRSNLIPPATLGEVINRISQNTNPQLWAVTYGLPVAGFSGTLDYRFASGSSRAGRGEVRAKTGTLQSVSALSGTVTSIDGDLLTFVFMAPNASDILAAASAWDSAAAALARCGCQ